MKYLIIALLIFPFGVSADIFLDNASITGNLADHNEVVSFAVPKSYSWEADMYSIGYRVWFNEYQMVVLTVEMTEEIYWTTCMSYEKDLSQHTGLSIRDCTLQELSATLYYMPEITLLTLNEYWNK